MLLRTCHNGSRGRIKVFFSKSIIQNTGVLISPWPDQEGNKLQRQKILMFVYPIYNRNWRSIGTIYIHNMTSYKRNILTIKIHREVGRAKDLSAPRGRQDKTGEISPF